MGARWRTGRFHGRDPGIFNLGAHCDRSEATTPFYMGPPSFFNHDFVSLICSR